MAAPEPRYPRSVFIFGDVSSGVFEPVGTCFAITNELLLTCQHNLQGRRLTQYAFALTCERTNDVITCYHGCFEARVLKYNVDMDYALIESVQKKDLVPIPLSISPIEPDLELKVFHLPVDYFNDRVEADDSLAVYTRWVRSSRPTRHHVKCDGGLYPGSSGAPFVMRDGRAIGFFCEAVNREHSESSNEEQPLDDGAEVYSATVNSRCGNHASFCRALLIGYCKALVEVLREFHVPLHA